MKNAVIVVIVLALFGSLYYNFTLSSRQSGISEVTQQVSFEKKQECSIYKKQIEDKFEKNNNGDTTIEFYYFDRIFYSPQKNSCLYLYRGYFGLKVGERYRRLYLEDALTGDVLVQATVEAEGKYNYEAEADFNQRVNSYE